MSESRAKKARLEFDATKAKALVQAIASADKMSMFHLPVDPKVVPDYYEIIKNPICLADVTRKITSGTYRSNDDLLSDLQLMINNALEFNTKGDEYYQNAARLKKKLPQLLKSARIECVEEDSDSDFAPEGRAEDDWETLKEETLARENVKDTLSGMTADLDISLEALRAMYKGGKGVPAADDESSTTSGSTTTTSDSTDDSSDDSSDDTASSSS